MADRLPCRAFGGDFEPAVGGRYSSRFSRAVRPCGSACLAQGAIRVAF